MFNIMELVGYFAVGWVIGWVLSTVFAKWMGWK